MATILFSKDGDEVRVKNAKKVTGMLESGEFFVTAPDADQEIVTDEDVSIEALRAKAEAAGIKNAPRKGVKRLTEELAAIGS